jgi:prephenate dehydrogenase
MGIVDRAATLDSPWQNELADADVVLLAAPVAQYPALMASLAPHLGPHTIVTDAGSTKQDVIAAARSALTSSLERFVPAHPLAGTEHSGAAAAFPSLFQQRNVVLTPMPETAAPAVDTIDALWTACGARICRMNAAAHDRIFAAVSHLPHLLAFALVDAFASRGDAEELFRFAASGFRDFTRIAASSPEMWRDISLANRAALLEEVAAFRRQLDRVASMIATADGEALEAVFAHARSARRDWEQQQVTKASSGQRE